MILPFHIVPFLANYSSDFICYVEDKFDKGYISLFLHDDPKLIIMHRSPIKFLKTINEFYKKNVFFLDEDGYLDLKWDKEGKLGLALNPDAEYWNL
ncbi:hypothetical protein [Mesobacillus jeotgali]|uniref:hypothetical protein n=1 Tax=Mesobacillus jeotgali TaxID=129985 RepID=UPI0009A6F76D|nr:hypothetical protein [Mesobacillus jeotgali]